MPIGHSYMLSTAPWKTSAKVCKSVVWIKTSTCTSDEPFVPYVIDKHTFEVQYVIYGSRDHSPRSHKSRIDLQTHIVCFVVTFPKLACHYRMHKCYNDVIVQSFCYLMFNIGHTICFVQIKEVKVQAVPLVCPCKS